MKNLSAPKVPLPPAKKPAASPASQVVSGEHLDRLQENFDQLRESLDQLRRAAAPADGSIKPDARPGRATTDSSFRVYLERMQEGAVTVDAAGSIIYCNRRFAEMVGQPLEKSARSSLPQYLSSDVWHRLSEVFGNAGEVVKFEATLLREKDSGLPVSLTASRFSPEGPPILCLVVTDLSPLQEKEDLRRAKEAAEKASAAKDEFLAALSHELRTPLTPALMAATMLEKDAGLPESARSDISLIRRNVELEARLIDDLLDLTLITHGKLSLQTEEINLHATLNRAIEIVQADARQKRQSLQIELDARRTMITGDPVRVQQVCWNVLRNAVKFTPERGTISITSGNDDHDRVWVRIADTGIGFPPDQAGKIFEAFEQGGRHISRQFGGLGLGLAISRSIMHAHGGGIEAHSSGRNQGATFTLRFPLSTPAAARNGAARPTATVRAPGFSILLVEDHKDTRLCIQRLLEAASYRITAAATAQEALDLAQKNRFDLVISDLGLPDLSGHELMRRLHADYRLPGIALSGYGMEGDLAQSREAGFKYHLTKPVSFDRLKSFVAEFAAKRETAPQAAGTSV